jgi:hypothetical protein
MYGVSYSLDVLFLDRHGEVIAVYPGLAPWKRTSWYRRAMYALELPAGTVDATSTAPGDFLAWLPSQAMDEASRRGLGVTQDVASPALSKESAATLEEGRS